MRPQSPDLEAARTLLRLATKHLVAVSSEETVDDVSHDLADLVTLVEWQCEAPDQKAIDAACKPLRKAKYRREAAS